MSTLPATLPGLLRRGSPVVFLHTSGRAWHGPTGTVTGVFDRYVTCLVTSHGGDGDGNGEVRIADLALDLSDEVGMDRAARWLAEQVGLRLGCTAPRWWFDRNTSEWILAGHGDDEFPDSFAFTAHDPNNPDDTGGETYRVVPGASTIADPVQALRHVCLALGAKETA